MANLAEGPGAAGVWVVVVAAGEGNRYGGRKQFAELSGRPVVSMALEAARSVASGIVLVVPASIAEEELDSFMEADLVVRGGATRADSVRAGLAAVPTDAEIVVIHDARGLLPRPGCSSRS